MNKHLHELAKTRICYISFENHFEHLKPIQNLYIGYHENIFFLL